MLVFVCLARRADVDNRSVTLLKVNIAVPAGGMRYSDVVKAQIEVDNRSVTFLIDIEAEPNRSVTFKGNLEAKPQTFVVSGAGQPVCDVSQGTIVVEIKVRNSPCVRAAGRGYGMAPSRRLTLH